MTPIKDSSYTNKAIISASGKGYRIRGGFIWGIEGSYYVVKNDNQEIIGLVCLSDILIDPLFFQCLGKAMGWEGKTYFQIGSRFSEHYADWKIEWHRFIDHLASGETIEKYFESLTP